MRDPDLADIVRDFQLRGLRVKTVPVQGRFHSAALSSAAEKLNRLCVSLSELQFPTVDDIQVPLRSTVNGEIIKEGPLQGIALESMLLKPADWFGTVKTSVGQLPANNRNVAFAGFGNHIPPSLLQNSSLAIISLSKLDHFQAKRLVEASSVHGLATNTSVNGTSGSGTSVNGTPVSGTSAFSDGVPPPGESQYPPHSIAIVGMACRFPGADSVDEFWQLLLSGASMVEPAPSDRLKMDGPRIAETISPDTKWWGNFLRDADAFDHRFFKKSSREALSYDPQQRILLEVAYEAMESSGYFGAPPVSTPTDYGCYIGVVCNNYYDNVSCHAPTAYSMLGTSRSFFSGRLSHHFGWTGPSMSVDTACSSSLVAINTACKAIQAGECSRAIAGGTNVFTSPFDYQNLAAAGFLSPTGACKPFDAAADGYCRGEGVAVVVLKPLATAIEEKDNILGVIAGSAVNQNENCSHITVPHSGSQTSLYRKVSNLAGVDPRSVSYVEAHGTGTVVGDPLEVMSIREAFGGASREQTLYFGSVKGHIGHTEATAGIAGLIKVLLMMQHGMIPAQASFSRLNPKIPPLEGDRMDIPRTTHMWTSSSRLACINSYGAAGSNAAVIVRPKPDDTFVSVKANQTAAGDVPKYPLFISAASTNSLSMYCGKLLSYIKDLRSRHASDRLLSDLAFNLADRGNHSLPHVAVTTVTDLADLEDKLDGVASGSNTFQSEIPRKPMPVVLVFGGQESDIIGISEVLYRSSSLFRHHLDHCNEVVDALGFESLYPAIFQPTPISNPITLHSALFAVQYSSAKTWMDCGLEISAVVGHSFGQLTALCISGCLSLEHALKLVAGRASLMLRYWGPERGSMIALQTNEQNISPILDSFNAKGSGDDVEVACFNGSGRHILVGSTQSIEALEKHVTNNPSLRDSVRMKRLRVTHGFHSKFTDPVLPHLTTLAKELDWRLPAIYLETCTDVSSYAEPDFRLVAEHMRRPVFFDQAVDRLAKRFSACTWLEAGHGSSVMQLVRGTLGTHPDQGHLILSPQLTTSNAAGSLSEITSNLWKAGYRAQYWLFHRSQKQQHQFLTLPPYQFEKTRHWLPFSERNEIAASTDPVQETSKHEFLSFVKFNDSSHNEAKFRVDPRSERYQSLLNAHLHGGQALAPVSLYFELITRAALSLHSDSEDMSYVPCVESIQLKYPVGLDSSKDILLYLTRNEATQLSWSFVLSSQTEEKSGRNNSEPVEHVNGKVYLQKRDHLQMVQNFRRYESLIGFRRCEEVMNNPEAETMQGSHIYRAISQLVSLGDEFHGVRRIAALRNEAAGRVVKSVTPNAPLGQRLCETPMIDSFLQFAGLLVNYFTHPSDKDIHVVLQIGRFEIGGSFNPEAKEWIVYANLTEDNDRRTVCDIYVFEAESKKLVITILDYSFSRASQSVVARILKGVNGSITVGSASTNEEKQAPVVLEPPTSKISEKLPKSQAKKPSSKRSNLIELLHKVTDIPAEELTDESTLEELGIDSLMVTEVLNEIRAAFGLNIDLTDFLFLPNIRAICAHIDSKLGIAADPNDNEVETISDGGDVPHANESSAANTLETPKTSSDRPSLTSAHKAFEEIRYEHDRIGVEVQAANFWTQVYPTQARLVLAYVVEGFAALGCDVASVRPGDPVPEIQYLPRHKQLVRQLHRILEDAQLVSCTGDQFFRTNVPIDPTPADVIYREILDAHPQHANVHKVTQVPGSQLAACLTGEKDAIQLLFGDKTNKQNLDDMYENWPLLRSCILLLGEFLLKALSNADGHGKFRIIEVGAGTGGTTKYIVNYLRQHGISFEYIFTDLSASLVAAAKRRFKGIEGMEFSVLDVEKSPPDEYLGEFDVVISTNCVHATANLKHSLSNLRKMLRKDGVLTLVEVTQNMFWMDIAVGLFEGWWLFNDGRSHVVASETLWERDMKEVGFKEVAWSDGDAPESQMIRVIAGFNSARA